MNTLNLRAHAIRWLAALGSLLGAIAGLGLGRAMLLRTAKAELSVYAQQLVRNADALDRELDVTFARFNAPGFDACSEPEMWALKAQTFRSDQLKDIGRTHEGKLYCSAALGRLKTPYIEGPPTLLLTNGTRVYTDVALILASMGGDHGTIFERGDVNVVLSPHAFDYGGRPHTSYMIAALNPKTGEMARIAGTTLGVEASWVLAHLSEIRNGQIYVSFCPDGSPLCAVATESIAAVWDAAKATQIAYSAMGTFAGLSLGLVIALVYLRTSALSYRLHRDLRRDSPLLRLVYEPILNSHTSRIVGAEALLRWEGQNSTLIPPEMFVRLAEEHGYINELTAYVTRRAIAETGDLLRLHPEFTLSINIAVSDMNGSQLLPLLERHVLQANIDPRQIALELTERSTADLTVVGAAVLRLRAVGYKVYIDDFGTGFSSLSYIDRLAVNAIKIDRSFTRTVGTDAITATLLPQIISMAQSLGLEIVVEGVETRLQRDHLSTTEKAIQLQGWYFSKPLTAKVLASFLMQNDVSIEAAPAASPSIDQSKADALVADPRS